MEDTFFPAYILFRNMGKNKVSVHGINIASIDMITGLGYSVNVGNDAWYDTAHVMGICIRMGISSHNIWEWEGKKKWMESPDKTQDPDNPHGCFPSPPAENVLSRMQSCKESQGNGNQWCFRPWLCTVRLSWARDYLGKWDEFCYESCPWCRIDRSTCWFAVQSTTTVPWMLPGILRCYTWE